MKKPFRYDDACALKYFINAVKAYPHKKIDESFFTPYTRCDRDERFVHGMMDEYFTGDDSRRTRCGYLHPSYSLLQDLWHEARSREVVRKRLAERGRKILRQIMADMGEPAEKTRLDQIATFIHLNKDERKILEICWLCTTGRINEDIALPYNGEKYEYFAMLTGIDEITVREILAVSGKLRRFGVVNSRDSKCELTEAAFSFMGGAIVNLTSAFYDEDRETPLPSAYFAELSERHLPVLKSLLKGGNGRGVNIILYGASGTGKTSFARRIAKDAGRRLLKVVQSKVKDGEYATVESHDRCTALRVCSERADVRKDVILVDEADNLLGNWDKGSMNVILDNTAAPVIWIANVGADDIDPSMRRRFDYSIRFEPFDREGRQHVWRNALEKAKVALPAEAVRDLASKYAVNAGVVARAIENAKKIGGPKVKALERFLDQAMELSGGKALADSEKSKCPAEDYSLDGLNVRGDIPLESIIECVRNFCSGDFSSPDAPRMNILLSGPAGSGKSEFVKYIAKQVKRPLEIVTGSQLLDKWVGGTEKNIAAAFRRAKANNAILFLDEIDSFLQDRKDASHRWEVSQVNELLQQMESFGGVMIGATNFADRLDRAVSRRFTFKLTLDYLTPEGRCKFFKRFFGLEAEGNVRNRLAALDNLAPGDFRTARQSLYYLGGVRTPEDFVAALERECDAKRTSEPHVIGFHA